MAFVRTLADVVMSTGLAVVKAHPGYRAVARRVVTYYPPVDVGRFAPRPEARARVRAQWGIPVDVPVVGCVANINPQKGIDQLVRAVGQVRASVPDCRLVLIGAEYATHVAYSATVRAEIRAAGLIEGRDVLFLGDRDDVETQLAGLDVFALAAVPRSEGITTAMLEAMASGLPVVVTDVGSLREALDDGRAGIVVPPGDVGAFAGALQRLLSDRELLFRMSAAAREISVERFPIDVSARAHAVAYERALRSRRRAGRPAPSTR